MNIADQIGFEGLIDMNMPEEMRSVMQELISRLESFRQKFVFQLRSEPTVFAANPVTEPEKIEGSKTGDIAVWIDGAGVSQMQVL